MPASYLYRRSIAEQDECTAGLESVRKVAQDREYVTLAALSGGVFEYVPGFFAVYNRVEHAPPHRRCRSRSVCAISFSGETFAT